MKLTFFLFDELKFQSSEMKKVICKKMKVVYIFAGPCQMEINPFFCLSFSQFKTFVSGTLTTQTKKMNTKICHLPAAVNEYSSSHNQDQPSCCPTNWYSQVCVNFIGII